MEPAITIQWSTLLQWASTLVTIVVIPLIGLLIRWVYHGFKDTKEHAKTHKNDVDIQVRELKQEILVRSKSVETLAYGAKQEVSRLETKMAAEYVSKPDLDRVIDVHFNQMFTRMDNLEDKMDRLFELRIAGK